MKKILIVNNNMNIGGIQKALLNLLCEIGKNYDVTLLLFCKTGGLADKIPENIKVIEGNVFLKILGMSHAEAKQCGFVTFFLRSVFAVLTRIFKTKFTFNILSRMFKLNEEFDCAISYMQNSAETYFYGGCAEFVLNGAKSKNKVCFIHCDFLNYGGNTKYNREILKKFNKIAVVSNSVGKRLLTAVPSLEDKVYTVHNCVNFCEIERLKDEYEPKIKKDCISLFTASRISEEKGILRMFPIFDSIRKKGINFMWYIAGDGAQKAEAETLCEKCGLTKNVVFLGNLTNPYPYFYKTDIVLVPSYNEAAPMVFNEAEVLGTYIFTTDTASAKEMVGDKNIGFVCGNTDAEIEKNLFNVLNNFESVKIKPQRCCNALALKEFGEIIK